MIGNSFLNGRNFFNNGFFNRGNAGTPTVRNPHTHKKVEDEVAATAETEDTVATEDTEETTDVAPVEAEEETSEDAAESEDQGTSTATSILDDFHNQLKSFLMDSLGLSVGEDGSISFPGAEEGSSSGLNGLSAYGISAQFELNYSATMAVAGANGISMQQVNFSMSASFEMMGVSAGNGSGFNPFATENADGSEATDPFSKLQEMFSPEKTAERILNFALSFFGQSDQFEEHGDTEEGRSQFADYIGAAVQKGFDQAMGILGDIPEQTADEIDQTHQIVFDGFDDFVKNGYNHNKSDLYNSIQSYTSSFELNYSSTSIYYSNDELADMGIFNNRRGANAYQAAQQAQQNQAAQQQPVEEEAEATVVDEANVDYEA